MSRILVIEDNPKLAQGIRNNLELEGHEVLVAENAQGGLHAVRERAADLIILDLMLPDQDGLWVLRELRGQGDRTPVLILTALGDEADKVRGLRLGADDYVTKPFGLLELLARVEALLRRARGQAPETPRARSFGAVTVDPGTRTVTRDGAPVPLRPKEYELLLALLRREGTVVSRLELLKDVWGYQDDVLSRTVDTHVGELRRKLEADPANPRLILTVRKAGYRLALSDQPLTQT